LSAPNRSQQRKGGRSISNRELADRIDFALNTFCEAILDLKRQQHELAERIRFIAPTQSDVTREVQEFIDKSLAA
jgi:hypothetical protein